MRKIPLILLTLITIAVGNPLFSAKTYALATTDKTLYTIPELLEYKEELGDDAVCFDHGGFDCFGLFMPLENEKMRAFSVFTGSPLTITSFNPSLGTITLYYQGALGEDLKNVHAARFDAGDPDYTFNETARYSLPLKPSTHLAVSEKEEVNGEGWFSPGQEKTFQMIDANFEDDIDPVFWFFFDTASTSWGGQYNYRDCIESPDYQEGMECHVTFSDERPVYVPAAVAPAETLSLKLSQTEPAETSTTTTPKAPETGVYTKPCIEKTVEFPWWIGALILIGNLTLLWLFWPKNAKKSKKPIDKTC